MQYNFSHLRYKDTDPRVLSWVLCNRVPGSWADSRTFYPCRGTSYNRSRLAARTRRPDCSNGCQAKCGPGRARRRPWVAGTSNYGWRRTRVLHARWPCSARARACESVRERARARDSTRESLSRARRCGPRAARLRHVGTARRFAHALLANFAANKVQTKAKVPRPRNELIC